MESIKFEVTSYGTPLYHSSVDLRYLLLRKPLNMVFSEKEKSDDKKGIHIVGLHPHNPQKVISVCYLLDRGDGLFQIKQVCVDKDFQKKGIGSQMMAKAEQTAKQNGASKVMASADKKAIGFYIKLNYEVDPEVYLEVGIPHQKVSKNV